MVEQIAWRLKDLVDIFDQRCAWGCRHGGIPQTVHFFDGDATFFEGYTLFRKINLEMIIMNHHKPGMSWYIINQFFGVYSFSGMIISPTILNLAIPWPWPWCHEAKQKASIESKW